jgi:hypothetical protein
LERLDLLDWDIKEAKQDPPFAKYVIEELRLLKSLFASFLTDQQKQAILAIIKNLEKYSSVYKPDERTGGYHRQSTIANRYPIYTSLDPDPSGEHPEPKDRITIERTARIALLLHHIGGLKLPKTEITQLASVCRNFRQRNSGIRNDTETNAIHKEFKNALREMDWSSAIKSFGTLSNHQDTINKEYFRHLEFLIPAIKALETITRSIERQPNKLLQTYPEIQIRQRSQKSQKSNSQLFINDRNKSLSFDVDPDPDESPSDFNYQLPSIDDDLLDTLSADKPAGEIIVGTEVLDTGTKELSPSDEVRLSLAIRGNHLQMLGIYSGQSADALLPIEAQNCMEWLTNYETSTEAVNIARCIWILQGLTGFRFDNLFVGLSRFDTDRLQIPNLHCEIKEETVFIYHEHIIAEALPDITFANESHPKRDVTNLVMSSVNFNQDPSIANQLHQLEKITSRDNPLINDILQAKQDIKKELRKTVCDRFNESRWRAPIIQAIFNQHQDLPLLQLMFGEQFGVSTAPLHYLAFRQKNLRNIRFKAQSKLFPNFALKPTSSDNNLLVGASAASIDQQWFRQSIENTIKTINLAEKNIQSIVDRISLHNLLVNHLGMLIGFTTATRNNNDFHNMLLNQISFNARLAVFEDKRSDPSILRRVTALDDYTLGEIERYLENLAILANHSGKFKPKNTITNIKNRFHKILTSEEPLLFNIEINERPKSKTPIQNWNGRTVFKEAFGSDIPANIFRHLFSTQMRELRDLSPVLIETQLGHNVGYNLFGDDSVISPLEFSEKLRPYLSQYLSTLGYPSNTAYKASRHMQHIKLRPARWTYLHEISKQQEDNDTSAIQKLKKITEVINTPKSQTIKQRLYALLLERYGDPTKPSELKSNVILTINDSESIYQTVLSEVGSSIQNLQKTAKVLRVQLKHLRDLKQWQVDLPPPTNWRIKPPITFAITHLIAYEELIKLRTKLGKTKIQINDEFSLGQLVLIFMAFGGSSSINETYNIFKSSNDHIRNKAQGSWLVDTLEPIKESRTITGIPLYALQKSTFELLQKIKLPNLNEFTRLLLRALPEPWGLNERMKKRRQNNIDYRLQAKSFEYLLTFGRLIELPPLLHAIHTGKKISRELTKERLNQFLCDSGNNLELANDFHHTFEEQSTNLIDKKNPQRKILKKSLKDLTLGIRGENTSHLKNKSGRPIKSAKSVVRKILNDKNTTPLIAMLAEWAECLLADHANLRSEGKLATSTVVEYINTVARVLIPIFENQSLDEIDEDSLYSMINDGLSEKNSSQIDEAGCLTRLFFELPSKWEMPKLVFGQKSSTRAAKESIDSRVLTSQEIALSTEQLIAWSNSSDLPSLTQSALQDGVKLFDCTAKLGTRRSELQYLKSKDIIKDNNNAYINVRYNRKRTLKTKASARILNCTIELNDSASKDEWVFSSINNQKLGFDPFLVIHDAMRFSTGDVGSHLHSLRHTKASLNFVEIFEEQDITKRIKISCMNTMKIGHSNIATTATHYGHNLNNIISYKYMIPITFGQIQFISSLTNKKISYISRTLSDEISYLDISKKISNKKGHNQIDIPYKKNIQNEPPKYLYAKEMKPSSIIKVIFCMIKNGELDSAIQKIVSKKNMTIILKALIEAQYQFGWEAISPDIIQNSMSCDDYTPTDRITNKTITRRNISVKTFKKWSKDVALIENDDQSYLQAMSIIRDNLISLDLTKPQILWRLTHNVIDDVKNSLNNIHAPIIFDDSSPPAISIDQANTNDFSTTKSLILVIVILSRLSVIKAN